MDDDKGMTTIEKPICSRHKQTDIFFLPSGKQLRVVAEMKDSIHHLYIEMVVDHPSLRIRSINCDMASVPDLLCRQAHNCFAELIGKRVLPGLLAKNKQDSAVGCTHMTNLFHDACYNLIIAQGHILKEQLEEFFPDITEAQILKFFLMFRPELGNSCIRYADNSPVMDVIRNSPLPQNADQFVELAKRRGQKGP